MSNNTLAVWQKVANPIAEAKSMAKAVASVVAGTSPEQGEAIALVCMCEGIHPLDFARRYHWIPGKGASMRSDAMLGEFELNEGGSYRRIEKSPKRAAIWFRTKQGDEYELELTRRQLLLSRWPWASNEKNKNVLGWRAANIEVAKMFAEGKSEDEVFAAMLPHFKDNWGTELDWQNMLFARLVSDSLRSICAKLVAGVYTPEEMYDADNTVEAVSFTPPTTRPTAADVMASNASKVVAAEVTAAEPIPVGSDAEIVVEIAPEGVATEQLPFTPDNTNGHATRSQLDKLLELRQQMQLSDTDWNNALANRKVNAAHSLTKEQAAELIGKMESRIRAAAKN